MLSMQQNLEVRGFHVDTRSRPPPEINRPEKKCKKGHVDPDDRHTNFRGASSGLAKPHIWGGAAKKLAEAPT